MLNQCFNTNCVHQYLLIKVMTFWEQNHNKNENPKAWDYFTRLNAIKQRVGVFINWKWTFLAITNTEFIQEKVQASDQKSRKC